LFEILDTQRLMAGQAKIPLLPPGKPMLSELLAARPGEAVDGAGNLVPAES
jgi:hypothetical protein